ncbi:2-amino-4-hydroxy-6-hydroxymethyldihydropteridinepyrophosphokinase [BD1-7 clade bacterium]|uniref:2-amino-4-hydroxy-6-hydroxymethyldihydropteridine pyrophosphokinase n=1 Tax=BD1-7 clade bacterium TaxID=2029982 RepID=A0A5S9MTF7_9GAMM|nr:2-amino-4-hydroxy-6-hydroxymethyldihydropteridinepyrophosphokinase [BD1-7 clade bacterium]CAA0085131.1 2-amino-4-hydroxy-6-hydroxymethyldihydropteridinepyrophosphokinase [BD1-7 clade bacterium]
MNLAYIGLGSNLNNPLAQVNQAVDDISALGTISAQSSWYRSKPVGPQDQPDFINGVVALQTLLEPLPLLDALQSIEQAHHRIREKHWGPRTLDLDILLYNDACIDDPRLSIPHPWMTERAFVLIPLAEIASRLTMPNGHAISELALNTDASGLEKIA